MPKPSGITTPVDLSVSTSSSVSFLSLFYFWGGVGVVNGVAFLDWLCPFLHLD